MLTSSLSFPSTLPKSNGLQCGDLSFPPLSSASPLPLRGCGPAGQVPWDTGFSSPRPPPCSCLAGASQNVDPGTSVLRCPDASQRHWVGRKGRAETHILLPPSTPLTQLWCSLSLQLSVRWSLSLAERISGHLVSPSCLTLRSGLTRYHSSDHRVPEGRRWRSDSGPPGHLGQGYGPQGRPLPSHSHPRGTRTSTQPRVNKTQGAGQG